MAHHWQGTRNKTTLKKPKSKAPIFFLFFFCICIFEQWMLRHWAHSQMRLSVCAVPKILYCFLFPASAAYLLKLFGELCLPNFNSWLYGNGAAPAKISQSLSIGFYFVCELSLCVPFCPAISIWTGSSLFYCQLFFLLLLDFAIGLFEHGLKLVLIWWPIRVERV